MCIRDREDFAGQGLTGLQAPARLAPGQGVFFQRAEDLPEKNQLDDCQEVRRSGLGVVGDGLRITL